MQRTNKSPYIPVGWKCYQGLPATEIFNYSMDLMTTLTTLIDEYFLHLNKPQWLVIFRKRFTLSQKTSLSAIGKELNLTRERTRQILFIIMFQIKKLIKRKVLSTPRLVFKGKNNFAAFEKDISGLPAITLNKVNQILSKYSKIKCTDYLDFLMAIYGYNHYTYKNKKFYYKIFTAFTIVNKITTLKYLLSGQALFISKNDLQKKLKIHSNLDFYLEFITDLQVKKYKNTLLYRLPMKCLRSIHCCVYRILHDIGSPIHMSEINIELVKHGKYANIHSHDRHYSSKIVPIGSSGKWGLREWNINCDSVPKLIEKFLLQINKPVTLTQIFNSLNKIRRIDNKLISSTIRIYKQFVQYDDDSWGLKIWKLKKLTKIRNNYHRDSQIRDEIIKLAVKICKEKMLLAIIVKEISKQGYLIPTIYRAIDSRPDLFVKVDINQKRKFICCENHH